MVFLHVPGSHEWENRYDNGIWTYTMEDVWEGLQDCYQDLLKDVKEQYGATVTTFGSINEHTLPV